MGKGGKEGKAEMKGKEKGGEGKEGNGKRSHTYFARN